MHESFKPFVYKGFISRFLLNETSRILKFQKARSQVFVQIVKYHHKGHDISTQKQNTLPGKVKAETKTIMLIKNWGTPVRCALDRAFRSSGRLRMFSLMPE
jgi:hypothetical protein